MAHGALIPLAASVAIASLAGSPHCAAMCGGFVVFGAGQDGARRILPQAAYHLGRLTSYVSLGLLAGALGVGLDHLGAAAGLHRAAAVVAGLTMLLWGGLSWARAIGARLPRLRGAHRAAAPIAAVLRRVAGQPPAVRSLVLGLVTTLLPCGWLYLYVAAAAGTGSAAAGAVVMAAFWIGTVPVLASLGVLARRAIEPIRLRLPALSSAVLIVFGLLTITGKFHAAAHGHAHAMTPAADRPASASHVHGAR
jgi:sulfite exporter TauE/SafE